MPRRGGCWDTSLTSGGWARPFAVRMLKEGNVNHPVYGWVPKDWVAHLEAGELPAPMARGPEEAAMAPRPEADELRSNWKNPWVIPTEHFEIKSDVPLAEAIVFARRLEAFYDLFFTLMADVVGENLPLARRFRSPALTGEASYQAPPGQLLRVQGRVCRSPQVVGGTRHRSEPGLLQPAPAGQGQPRPAYFFRDPGGQLPVTATLYHEVSHQLLFETAGPNGYTKNAGNYWVFEGLGTYFETVTPRADGSLEVGGLVGERILAARQDPRRRAVPPARSVSPARPECVQSPRGGSTPLPAGHGPDGLPDAVERRDATAKRSSTTFETPTGDGSRSARADRWKIG